MAAKKAETVKKRVETSLSLDYRARRWGIERIVLDGVCNHLPEDSNGNNVYVRLKRNGKYVDLKDFKSGKRPVEEIVFEDDGSGYDSNLLGLLHSTKVADGLSVGQFGEGLKMVAAACLREGLKIEYRSDGWQAVPLSDEVFIEDKKTKTKSKVDRLCFDIETGLDPIKGSRTVFRNPTPELVQEVLQLPSKVLALNETYEELHNEKDNVTGTNFYGLPIGLPVDLSFSYIPGISKATKSSRYNSRIIKIDGDRKNPSHQSLFVKGVRIMGINSLFSYDLGLDDISPDRIYGNQGEFSRQVKSLLEGCANVKVIETVIGVAHKSPNGTCYEFQAMGGNLESRLEMPEQYGAYVGKSSFLKEKNLFEEQAENASKYKAAAANYFGLGKMIKDFSYFSGFSGGEVKKAKLLWAETFRKMYGDKAVLASDQDTNNDKDAKLSGFNPIRLNKNVAKYLKSQGIKSADEYAISKQEDFRWVDIVDLDEKERQALRVVGGVFENLTGKNDIYEIRVFSKVFKGEHEIQTNPAVCGINQKTRKPFVAFKRDTLDNLPELARSTIHELGHHETGVGDYDRRFAEYFVRQLAERLLPDVLRKIQPEPEYYI